ncbi:E3 ubiquitin-protein ligase TRIM39-like [Falco biarmicus]|uniref:E3 ubiquitin-protein ligase TRIM39 n=1 Tax=Falco cherrug TaxID=345164 RepID=UPI001886A62A|nr:E3 ubiquitin-protein ligase TRIM39 [Falco cherrug]XP_037227893.1 E3 ubiquitin-protein ligase TRIM39-like [Falco rusticolus]XP_055648540.1 LOW QUALITY PROTEIN: E3 ubiquitin-protein ligase TRIM39-like [Falco peregrinus]XP_056179036.1 E3 ubiquitin-protein ligase TRIM39-like [Falco biarmicus]
MSGADPLETLQVEASCSVCLEYLQDPVIIECGHNFCRRCITRWWAELARDFPCPVCRKTSRHRALRPNRQLGNMVEAARQLRGAKRKAREESRCQAHGQALARFCRDDQAPVCLLCEISHAHRAHALVPLDDAALEYKEKLQRCLEPLERKLEAVAGCRAREEKKPGELKRKVALWRERIAREFEELHQLLEEEERLLLQRLEEEEREILQRLQANLARLGEQRRVLAALVAELEEKCLQSGAEMLKDIKDTLARCEAAAVPVEEPVSVPIELEKNFCSFPRQYFTLRKITRRLIGEVTLDPDTAHPNLVLSEDRKSVRFVEVRPRDLPDTPRRFTIYPCVLAAQGFTSGRHYWEVEVGDKTHWALGVCKDSVSRKGELTPLPETGYWRVRLWNGNKYAATTTPFTPLTVRVKPKRVGVFVDYEAGKVAFYNVTDRSHIYTFTDTFTEKIWPLFYPGIRAGRKNAAPLVIRSPTDWE